MKCPFSVSKVTPPSLPKVVNRPRLLDRLEGNHDRRLIFILGQAAQGKPTLAASLVERSKIPSAWVNIQEEDSDPVILYYSIVYSIQYLIKEADLSSLTAYPASEMGPRSDISLYREWTNAIGGAVPVPMRIVLDGIDRVPAEAKAWLFLKTLLEELPRHISLIVISRQEPPFGLQELKIKKKMEILVNKDLAFTLEEGNAFIKDICGIRLSADALRRVHQFTEGWIGGFVLLAGCLEGLQEELREEYVVRGIPDSLKSEVFSYLGQEIFASQPLRIQEFLVKTSILESFASDFARDLTGISDAEEVLLDFVRRCLFVHRAYDDKRGWIFRYHLIFRDFLKSRLHSRLPENEKRALYSRAASLLEQRGELREAVDFCLLAGNLSSATAHIEKIGLSLLRTGRVGEIANWLTIIPQDLLEKSPWLLLYLSMTRRFTNAAENLKDLGNALSLFSEKGDIRGKLMSLALMIEASVVRGQDVIPIKSLIRQAEDLLRSLGGEAYPFERGTLWLQLGFALTIRGGNPRKGLRACDNACLIAKELGDRALEAQAQANALRSLAWAGEFDQLDKKAEEVRGLVEKYPNPNINILCSIANCDSMLVRGRLEKTLEYLQDARREAEAHGFTYLYPVTLLYDLLLEPGLHQYSAAEDIGNRLFGFAESIGNVFMMGLALLYLGRSYYFQGEYPKAAERITRSRQMLGSDKARSDYHLAISGVLNGFISLHLGDYGSAEKDLSEALNYFSEIKCFPQVDAHFAFALLKNRSGNKEDAVVHLMAGLKLAMDRSSDHFVILSQNDLLEVCFLAIELEIEGVSDYAQHLLSTIPFHMVRPALDRLFHNGSPSVRGIAARIKLDIHRAALPRIRIETLGGFRVIRGGSVMREEDWQGSQPKRLMKAIVSGGPGGVSKDLIIDRLWSDSAPDSAEKTFKAGLWRLRKSLEPDLDRQLGSCYVHLKNNQVFLDSELCEADVHEFISLLEMGESKEREGDIKAALSFYEKAIELFKGDFLPEELYTDWSQARRVKLKQQFIAALMKAAKLYEDRGSLGKAAEFCRKAIDADPLMEDAYRKLMTICAGQGKRNEALKVYMKCERALREGLASEPEGLTKAIYRKILG